MVTKMDVSCGRCSCWCGSNSTAVDSICLCDQTQPGIPLKGVCDRCMTVDPLTFRAHAHTLFPWTLSFDYSALDPVIKLLNCGILT